MGIERIRSFYDQPDEIRKVQMTPTDLQPAQPKAERRWSPVGWRKLFVFTVLFVACGIGLALWSLGLPLSWTADYDRERHAEIRGAIDADPQHLLGKPFDEVSRKLRLEDVPWDDIALQREPGMVRLYHFRGFSLDVTLERLPAGITPDRKTPWTATGEDLDRHGVLWLAHQYPSVRVDGVGDRKERMRRFWKVVEEECERINAEMERERQGNGRAADGKADSQDSDR